MNRTILVNPHDSEKKIVRCQMNDDDVAMWLKGTGIQNPPAGFRGYMRCTGNLMEYGVEPIESGPGAAKMTVGDGLDGKTVAELQTACAMKGIKYAKDDSKVALIQLLRAAK